MLVSPKWGMLVGLGWRNIGGIGLEGTLVALGLEGRWCPQSGGCWWDWVGSDVGGIGVGSDVGGIGAEGTLVALGLEGRWCPQSGGHRWHWGRRDVGVSPKWGMLMGLGLEVVLVALGLEGHRWRWG